MMRELERETFSYDALRRLLSSDFVAMELWKVINTAKMKPDKVKLFIDFVMGLSEETRQVELINSVWHRYYQLVAEQLLP